MRLPHEALKLTGRIVPAEGSIQEQVEDRGIDPEQGDQLYNLLHAVVRFDLQSGVYIVKNNMSMIFFLN